MLQKRNLNLFYILSIFVSVFAIWEAFALRWVCDDAFISFVYARNLFENGALVFNANEYVEGFSNFLWTILLSLGFLLNLSPTNFSIILGLSSFVCLLWFLFYLENELNFAKVLPIFLIHICLFRHNWIFATSGLETMSFVLFVTVGLISERLRGYAFFFACMTRPEGILFFGLYALSERKRWMKLENVLFSIVLVSLFFFRLIYFGDYLPNTFYAKASHGGNFLQGCKYIFYFFKSYPIYFIVFVYSVVLLLISIVRKSKDWLLNFGVLIYISYILYVGGDFMGIRFLMPILPYLSYLVYREILKADEKLQFESNKKGILKIYEKNRILLVLFFILSTALYRNPLSSEGKKIADWNGIAEEREFYENKLIDLSGYGDPIPKVRMAFFGAQAHFVYNLRPLYAFEAEVGLTDSEFAKREKIDFGRIGHNGQLTMEDLKKRNIHLIWANKFPERNLPIIMYDWRGFMIPVYVLRMDATISNDLCSKQYWDCKSFFGELKKRNLPIDGEYSFL